MGNRLDNTELEAALDKIFEFMEKKGIKVDESKKPELKKQIADDLYKELTATDIKDVEVQKKLLSCVVSLVMGKHNEYNEMISTLKSDEKLKPNAELDKKFEHRLTAQLMMLTMLSKVGDGDPKKNKESELTADELKQTILKSEYEKAKTPEDKQKVDVLGKQIDDTLRNLNGGHNPKFNGGVDFPILGPTFGNLLAYTNQSTPDPEGLSLMVDTITYNSRKTDPMGLENSTMLDDIAEGIDMTSVITPRNTRV